MSEKRQNYVLKAIEFLGVLLPGAIAAWAVMRVVEYTRPPLPFAIPTGAIGWAAFLVGSLVLGFMVQPLAQVLDRVYEKTYHKWKEEKVDPILRFAEKEAQLFIKPRDSVFVFVRGAIEKAAVPGISALGRTEAVAKLCRGISFFCFPAAAGAALVEYWSAFWGFLVLGVAMFSRSPTHAGRRRARSTTAFTRS